MNKLRINFFKWYVVFIISISVLVYLVIKIQNYIGMKISDGEIRNYINILIYIITMIVVILIARWTVINPARAIQKEKEARIDMDRK